MWDKRTVSPWYLGTCMVKQSRRLAHAVFFRLTRPPVSRQMLCPGEIPTAELALDNYDELGTGMH